jgi:arylsulfate sulfotransferase
MRQGTRFRSISACVCLAVFGAIPAGAMSVRLTASPDSPITVGTVIHFSAAPADGTTGTIWYRFRTRELGGNFQVIRDYGPLTDLNWTAADHEGAFEIEVSARSLDTGDVGVTSTVYNVQPLVTGGQALVTPTQNPLVFLYSAPACPAGQQMRVEFRVPREPIQSTPYKPCVDGVTMNFYIAGLRGKTSYVARHVLDTGTQSLAGVPIRFTTGAVPPGFYTSTVLLPEQAPTTQHVLLGSAFGAPVAHDLNGNVIWYGPSDISYITRPEAGGAFWGVVEKNNVDPSQEAVREFDLAGTTLRETNAARVNEQLKVLGRRSITSFHHEARSLPGGEMLVLGDVEQILTNVQGPGPVDVIGDMIIVLDQNLNVVWTWDTFDHLDVTRKAVLGETCLGSGACEPYLLAADANDWTHGNAVQLLTDGNLLYSSRHQDWVIKIAYANGTGDGHVIWKLGKDGDFQINSSDPYPWFSHQHDPNFVPSDPSKLLVFDDGNTRITTLGGGHSRGQVLSIDEQAMTATPVVNADLGTYSVAVGSAQQLSNGNYHFDAGYVPVSGGAVAYSFEVDGSGKIVYNANANAPLYRTFRLSSVYSNY